MENVSKETCTTVHKRVDERLDHHEKWLGEHEEKIDKLTDANATNTNEIKNLCKQMGGLTKAIWGLVTMVGASLIGFFFYVVEHGLK